MAAKDYLKGVMNGKTTIPTKTWKTEHDKLTAERKTLNERHLALNLYPTALFWTFNRPINRNLALYSFYHIYTPIFILPLIALSIGIFIYTV